MIREEYLGIAESTEAGRALVRAFASGDGGQSYLLASPDTLLCECIAAAAAAADGTARR